MLRWAAMRALGASNRPLPRGASARASAWTTRTVVPRPAVRDPLPCGIRTPPSQTGRGPGSTGQEADAAPRGTDPRDPSREPLWRPTSLPRTVPRQIAPRPIHRAP